MHPYKHFELAQADILNDIGLLTLQILQVGVSPFNTDPITRYNFGLAYDGGVILLFVLNIIIILHKIGGRLVLRAKMMFIGRSRSK